MVQFAPPYPAVILEDESKTRFGLIGDLHLGIEASFLRSSALFSTFISEGVIRDVGTFLREKSLENLILLGDLKHTFFTPSPEERDLLKSLFSLLEEEGVKLYVIKGNHDGRIEDIAWRCPWRRGAPSWCMGTGVSRRRPYIGPPTSLWATSILASGSLGGRLPSLGSSWSSRRPWAAARGVVWRRSWLCLPSTPFAAIGLAPWTSKVSW
jgi:hypothetical protein